jgi:hypothetical protein
VAGRWAPVAPRGPGEPLDVARGSLSEVEGSKRVPPASPDAKRPANLAPRVERPDGSLLHALADDSVPDGQTRKMIANSEIAASCLAGLADPLIAEFVELVGHTVFDAIAGRGQ